MPVPNTFGTATSAIPLSDLDDNFAAPITIGNTAVQLGNTVTTLNNMTLANVTISSGTINITNVAVTTANVSGTANISTLVVVGNATVGGNTTITGNITAANANVTTNLVLSNGTANGVAYLNVAKVLTTASALTWDGSALAVTGTISSNNGSANNLLSINGDGAIQSGVQFKANNAGPYTTIYFDNSTNHTYYKNLASGGHLFFNNTTQAMTLDANGLLQVGLTGNTGGGRVDVLSNATSAYTARSASSGAGTTVKAVRSVDSDAANFANAQYDALSHAWILSNSTQAMTLDASGNLLVGDTSGSAHKIYKTGTSEGNSCLAMGAASGNIVEIFDGRGGGSSAAATVMIIPKNSSTNRSVNAGGTVNASGADYAEYMTKTGNFTITKGDIVGINNQGKLTNVFVDAVSFVVKSTDPSYVGGDVWGTPEALGLSKLEDDATDEEKATFNTALEAARQAVDRIAFAGQVPVNVTGATAGQYIIPVNDNGAIKGVAKNETDLTMSDYIKSVGKVIAIESDGRAKIIVKVA